MTVNANNYRIGTSGAVQSFSSLTNIYGGYNNNGWAGNNTVNVTTGINFTNLYGGYSTNQVASDNTVIYAGILPTNQNSTIYGGYNSAVGTNGVSTNTVTINGDSTAGSLPSGVTTAVYGGYSENYLSDKNTVTINDGIANLVIGGFGRGTASTVASMANEVNITNGVFDAIIGGVASEGSVGGSSATEDWSNRVIIRGGTIAAGGSGNTYIGGSSGATSSPTITGGTIAGGIGYNGNGEIYNNSVSISGGNFNANVWGGWFQGTSAGQVHVNSVTVSGGSIIGNVYGGQVADTANNVGSAAYSNTVTVSAGSITGNVYGGSITYGDPSNTSGAAYDNTVNITGGTINGNVYSGYSHNGFSIVQANKLTISGGTMGSVYGGYGSQANKSIVNITGGTMENIYGGYGYETNTANGVANQNQLTIANATVSGDVIGGWAGNYNDNADTNTIQIDSGTFSGSSASIIGGYTTNGMADSNTITINGGTFGVASIMGGMVLNSGRAGSNVMTINGGTFSDGVKIYGGYGETTAYANGNNVTILSSVSVPYSILAGGYTANQAVHDNSVYINSDIPTTQDSIIYGGYSGAGDHGLFGNTVSINATNTGSLSSDVTARAYGAYSPSGNVHDNTVDLFNGTLHEAVGGYGNNTVTTNHVYAYDGYYGTLTGGEATTSDATDNTVEITGGTVTTAVYGGKATTGNTTGNTVTIKNAPTLTGATLYGGYTESGTSSGNKLEVYSDAVTAQNVKAFQEMDFYISDTITVGSNFFGAVTFGETMLNLTDTSGTDLSGVTISGALAGTGAGLSDGDEIILINNDNGLTTDSVTYKPGSGLTLEKFGFNSIIARYGSASASNNILTITDSGYTANNLNANYTGEIAGVHGGWAASDATRADKVAGGVLSSGDASNNTVEISGGNVTGDAYGGYSVGGDAKSNTLTVSAGNLTNAYGGYSDSGDVTENNVALSGGTVTGAVYAAKTSSGAATNNTVTISGSPTLTGATLYGGHTDSGASTGNTLNVAAANVTANNISDFQNINFALDSVNAGDTVLTLTDSNGTDLSGVAIDATVSSNAGFEDGTAVRLINNANGITTDNNTGYSSNSSGITVEKWGYKSIMARFGDATASNRTVTVTDSGFDMNGFSEDYTGTINSVYGGWVADDATMEDTVAGGAATDTTLSASSNTVTIDSGNIIGSIYGGYATKSAASSNTVYVSDGTINTTNIVSGFSNDAAASGNALGIGGGTITTDYLYGGSSANGSATENVLRVYDGTITANYVAGGFSDVGNVSLNESRIYGGTINANYLFGGYSNSGDVTTGYIPISGDSQITAGYLAAGYTTGGNATSNQVNLGVGSVTADYLLGGYSSTGNASSNEVFLLGGTANTKYIAGGYSASGEATGNTLLIQGGEIKATSYLAGGLTDSGSATGNTIIINGGHVDGDVIGGFSSTGSASGNTININTDADATRIDCYIVGSVTGDGVTSSDNTINISGSPDLTEAYLIGSANQSNYQSTVSLGAQGENNTLNIYSSALTAKNISGFDTVNFYLPSEVVNGSTVLTLANTDTSNSNGGITDLSGVAINAGVQANASSPLQEGDTITLITNANGITTSDSTTYGTLTEGVSLDWEFAMTADGNSVTAEVTGAPTSAKAQTEAIMQSAFSSVTLAEQVVDVGINWLPPEEETEEHNDLLTTHPELANDFHIFGNMGTSSLRTKTGDGSYIDTKNWGMDLGYAKTLDFAKSKVVFAPIVDYGRSSFDSYTGSGVHGHGNTSYLAGGMIGRKTFDNGAYIEGSFRLGRTQMDFASEDFVSGGQKIPVSYSATAPCWAGHINVGRTYPLNKKNKLLLYAMYHHTHQNGMEATLSTGDYYTFDAVDSGRLRIGAKLTKRVGKSQIFYSGLMYQYEYSGSASAHVNGYSTPDSSTSGSSAMVEMGWQVKPMKNSPWMLDLGVNAWVGMQQGVAATFKFKKSF